jgi:RTX calcium-binding nonapeptide repeat (4 copies)
MKKRIMVAMGLMAALLVVAAGVAWAASVNCQVGEPCVGTDEPDRLNGTNKPDDMHARQDGDLLRGLSGADLMLGDRPNVQNTTTDGADELFGNDGEDLLAGLGGTDVLRGGGQADRIEAREASENPGEDTVGGGGGKDVIFAHDNEFDTINCGANVDEVIFDKGLDRVAANCENRKPRTLTDQDAQAQEDLRAALSLR